MNDIRAWKIQKTGPYSGYDFVKDQFILLDEQAAKYLVSLGWLALADATEYAEYLSEQKGTMIVPHDGIDAAKTLVAIPIQDALDAAKKAEKQAIETGKLVSKMEQSLAALDSRMVAIKEIETGIKTVHTQVKEETKEQNGELSGVKSQITKMFETFRDLELLVSEEFAAGSKPSVPEGLAETVSDIQEKLESISERLVKIEGEVIDPLEEEYNRRLNGNFYSNGVQYSGGMKNLNGIDRNVTLADIAIQEGAIGGDYGWHTNHEKFTWPNSAGAMIELDVVEMIELGKEAAKFQDKLLRGLWSLSKEKQIPEKYKDDVFWI